MKLKYGFNLIELMILISFIGLIATIAIPSYINRQQRAYIDYPENQNNGIESEEDMSKLGKILHGEHVLRKINGENYFIKNKTHIRFSWLMNDGSFTTTYIPLTKVRLKFAQNSIPFIKYRWGAYYEAIPLQIKIDEKVIYVLIFCQEEIWNNAKNE